MKKNKWRIKGKQEDKLWKKKGLKGMGWEEKPQRINRQKWIEK